MKLDASDLISKISKKYYQLAFVVGRTGSGKSRVLEKIMSEVDASYINLSLALSERLLDSSMDDRRSAVPLLFNQLVKELDASVYLFDNIEVLFDPDFELNVLDLFLRASRNRVCVVAWSGEVVGGVLRFGEPGSWGYRSYNVDDVMVIDLNGEGVEV
ncbi:MAG: BREX-3 system P-loop-containing protein BrxF [Candidatus Ranarchaeia archaeon]